MILLKHYISYHWGLVHENGIRTSSKYWSQILGLTKLQTIGRTEGEKKILLLNKPPLIPIFFSGGERAMLLLQRKQDFEVPNTDLWSVVWGGRLASLTFFHQTSITRRMFMLQTTMLFSVCIECFHVIVYDRL